MSLFQRWSNHAGHWTGTNRFRLMPTDPRFDAPATAQITVCAGGNLVTAAYTWVHPDDGQQDGLLVVGPTDESGAITGFWGDSWHQQPAPRVCAGEMAGDVICVGYEYSPGWRWRITLDPTQGSELHVTMDNIVPETQESSEAGAAYAAMEMRLVPL